MGLSENASAQKITDFKRIHDQGIFILDIPVEKLISTYPVETRRASDAQLQEETMMRKAFCLAGFRSFASVVVLSAGWQARAQDTKSPYPVMAPVDQYLMDRTAEIALARSAAPDSISRDAEVMVLTRHGFETAVKGKNQFVCMVERSWSAGTDDPGFWNPKIRGPICFNPAGARYNIPITIKRTEAVLATQSKTGMARAVAAAFEKKEIPALEPGAMCFMMSKQQYLSRLHSLRG
jgi:hypothetical protein